MFIRLLRAGKEHATTARRVVHASGHHVGESWTKSETRRLAPNLITYALFIGAMVTWPYWVKEYSYVTHGKPNWSP
ncbi:hypothetical protein KDRO_F02350 [Kluyveromyces lactis]|nr:hypothetical protein KDRO_F02350 [Kluyveromyces lactis]